jgi:hypothetical protein
MIVTIDNESRSRARLSIDLDYSADRYKTTNDYFTFPAPVLDTIDKNLYYLLRNSKQIPLDKKYHYRPDYLSFDEYGTVSLAPLIMYLNNIGSLEQFVIANVVLPNYSAIMEILKDKFPDRKVDSLSEVNW